MKLPLPVSIVLLDGVISGCACVYNLRGYVEVGGGRVEEVSLSWLVWRGYMCSVSSSCVADVLVWGGAERCVLELRGGQ